MRYSATALFAAAVLVSGCKKTEKAPVAEPPAAGSAAPAATPPPAAAPVEPAAPATPPPAAPAADGPIVPSATLAGITMALPKPKGAPESGAWKAVPGGVDGDRRTNYTDKGSEYWVGLRLLDCNLPMVKEAAAKPAGERGELAYCFDEATGKLKDYPLYAPSELVRAVKTGHLVVIATLGVTGQTKLKGADLEAFLESLDLASFAKL